MSSGGPGRKPGKSWSPGDRTGSSDYYWRNGSVRGIPGFGTGSLSSCIPWGVFAIGDRSVPVLTELVVFNRHLREALPEIRSAPESALQEISEGIVRRFGTLMEALRMEIDGELVRYRDNLVSSVIHLRLLLKRGDRARAIGAVAEMSRKIAARVEAHGDLDRDGLPTSWELEHDLDPLRDDSHSRPRR